MLRLGASMIALGLLSTFVACGPPPQPARETRVSNARNGDTWLDGDPCPEGAVDDAALHVEDLEPGEGAPIEPGTTVRVHYRAALASGEKVRASRDSGLPIELVVGHGHTFCGFDRALVGMRAGGQRRVTIPARLAFGETGRLPDVPPKSDLVVVIDLYLPADAVNEQHSAPVNTARGGRRR